jgi:hypothetical protein
LIRRRKRIFLESIADHTSIHKFYYFSLSSIAFYSFNLIIYFIVIFSNSECSKRMELLKKVSSWYSGSETPAQGQTPEDDLCITCSDPCDNHACYPSYLANKINQTNLLEGTVKPYSKHIVICEGPGTEREWPSKIEKQDGSFAQKIAMEVKKFSEKLPFKILLTTSDEPSYGAKEKRSKSEMEAESSDNVTILDSYDIMLFPHMLRFIGVKKEQIPQFVKECLVDSNTTIEGIISEPIQEKNILLICAHKKRDKRCAVAGPLLKEEFLHVLDEKNLLQTTKVLMTSHFGGHKYAGNVIIYPDGNWYGRVIPCHCNVIVEKHLIEGKVIKKLWRGMVSKEANKTSW